MPTTRYLEVTFRRGKPLAAFFHLARRTGDDSARTVPFGEGLLIDSSADGRAIGIEITSPRDASLDTLNQALSSISQEPATAEEMAPLLSATR